MGYVDAGYSICLTVLFCYAVSLFFRHRRALRSATTVTTSPIEVAAGSVQMVGADQAGGAAPSDGESRRAGQSGAGQSGAGR